MANYEKTVLYIFPEIDKIVARVDEKFKEKVFSSKRDNSPALEQCNELIKLTEVKSALLIIKAIVGDWVKRLTDEERAMVEYKYFGKKSNLAVVDIHKRQYYRKQSKLASSLLFFLEKKGVTSEWFDKKLLHLSFIKEISRRVDLREKTFEKARVQLISTGNGIAKTNHGYSVS